MFRQIIPKVIARHLKCSFSEHSVNILKYAMPTINHCAFSRFVHYDNVSKQKWDLHEINILCNQDIWEEQTEGITLALKYIDTHFDEHRSVKQSAKIILGLHGTPENYRDLIPILQPFADEGYRILMPVMPGSGISSFRYRKEEVFFTHTSLEKANLIIQLLGTLGVRTVDLAIGHCTGACALTILSARTDICKSTFYLCPIPVHIPPRAYQPYVFIQSITRLYERWFFLRAFLPYFMKLFCYKNRIRVSKKYTYQMIQTAAGIGYDFIPGLTVSIEMNPKLPISVIYACNDSFVEEILSQEFVKMLGIKSEMILAEDNEDVTNYSKFLNHLIYKRCLSLNTRNHLPSDKKHINLITREMQHVLNHVNQVNDTSNE